MDRGGTWGGDSEVRVRAEENYSLTSTIGKYKSYILNMEPCT